MFNWNRAAELPLKEPSDAAIWATIDAYDPEGNVEITDRLQQYHKMLVGRDIYDGFFVRSPSPPIARVEDLSYKDPTKWVRTMRLSCGDFNPIERVVNGLSYGSYEVLQPVSDNIPIKGKTILLSHRQLQSPTLEWPKDSTIGRVPSPPRGYVTWARYILQAHKETLFRAGIYKAIYASLFDYGKIPASWARGVAESWDTEFNTCRIGIEEISISLWELQVISGLPIFGCQYEEYVPHDEELFRRQLSADGNRQGKLVTPPTYLTLLQWYYWMYEKAKLPRRNRAFMPVNIWMSNFLQKNAMTCPQVDWNNPFGLEVHHRDRLTEEIAEPLWSEEFINPALPGIDEEMSLIGFLIVWLSIFVLPRKENSIRPGVFLAAYRISRGYRISLAPVVLARIYRMFKIISDSGLTDLKEVISPWQYIHAWVNLHVEGAFAYNGYPPYFTEQKYPTVIQLAKATSILERERIRLFFFAPHLITDQFTLIHHPDIFKAPPSLVEVDGVDDIDSEGNPLLLHNRRTVTVAEYLYSIRPVWLCYRFNAHVTFEGYQPNRMARQFGFVQATADDGRPTIAGIVNMRDTRSIPIEALLCSVSATWAHLLRLGTRAKFRIATPNSCTGISFNLLNRTKVALAPIFERGARKYEPRVRSLAIPRKDIQRPKETNEDATPITTKITNSTFVRRQAPTPDPEKGVAPSKKK